MANINIGGATFEGRSAGNLIAREIIKGDSLSQGIFTIKENVKGAGILRTFKFDEGDLQAGSSCGFTPQGGDANNKKVVLTPIKANVEACKDEFNADWNGEDMEDGTQGGMRAEAVQAVTSEILRAAAIRVDKDIWLGIKTEAGADADVVDVTLTATTVTNILDEIGKMYSALAGIPGFSADGSFIAVSPQDKALYEQALAKAGAMPAFYLGEKGTNYLGVRIVSTVGVVKGDMYASSVANMFYLTDLDNDRNSVAVKDMDEHDLSGNIRFAAKWSSAASYAYGSELVLGATS